MHLIMATFVTQFRLLIGLDYYDKNLIWKITDDVIAPIEKDFLLRLGTVENLAVSKLTMQSLSHLLTKISNIVINEEVSKQVYSAVQDYHHTIDLLSKQDQMISAFAKSQTSFIS